MTAKKKISPAQRDKIIELARAGRPPEAVLKLLVDSGWRMQDAIEAAEDVMRDFLSEHARSNALPEPVRVPSPIDLNGPSVVQALDREVHVLANLQHPRVVVFGNLLSHEECDGMIELAKSRLARSSVVNAETGVNVVHDARTSEGMSFVRGANDLCKRIEARIAKLLDWPLENGEGLQILRYGPGAQYEPHYDYFDPAQSGFQSVLKRGGQRVASLVMYLNTPRSGGCTTFPDAKFEVSAVKGNAVFFSYDRPHPSTRTLHGGAPLIEGEKWVATKWLREREHI